MASAGNTNTNNSPSAEKRHYDLCKRLQQTESKLAVVANMMRTVHGCLQTRNDPSCASLLRVLGTVCQELDALRADFPTASLTARPDLSAVE